MKSLQQHVLENVQLDELSERIKDAESIMQKIRKQLRKLDSYVHGLTRDRQSQLLNSMFTEVDTIELCYKSAIENIEYAIDNVAAVTRTDDEAASTNESDETVRKFFASYENAHISIVEDLKALIATRTFSVEIQDARVDLDDVSAAIKALKAFDSEQI